MAAAGQGEAGEGSEDAGCLKWVCVELPAAVGLERWLGEPLDGEGDASVALELSLPPLSPQEEGQNVPRSSHSVPTLHPSTLRHTTARRGMNTHTRAHTHAHTHTHTHTHFFGGRI